MDSFTETILARARERQRMLKGYSDNGNNTVVSQENATQAPISSPNITSPPGSTSNGNKEHSLSTNMRQISERISDCKSGYEQSGKTTSYELSGSANSPVTNKLNIQKDNLNMEIRVTSTDNIRVEVEIEQSSDDEVEPPDVGLRKDVKDRLNRLGRLYAGGEDADISSPIHRTEEKFSTKCESDQSDLRSSKNRKNNGKGLKRLANLAEEINHWEDEVKPKNESVESNPLENNKSVKINIPKYTQPAPKPLRMSMVPSTPIKDRIKQLNNKSSHEDEPEKQTIFKQQKKTEPSMAKSLKWDRAVLDTLESQGFKRNEDAKLTYEYSPGKTQERGEIISKTTTTNKLNSRRFIENSVSPEKQIKKSAIVKSASSQSIAEKAAQFEPVLKKAPTQDPSQLSLLERKALFEKNKDVLVPKAPFGMAIPINANKGVPNVVKPVILNNVENKTEILSETRHRSPKKQESADEHPTHSRSPLKPIQPTCFASTKGSTSINRRPSASNSPVKSPRKMNYSPIKGKNKEVHEAIAEEIDKDVSSSEECMDEPEQQVCSMSEEEDIRKPRRSGSKRHSVSPKVAAVLGDVKRIRVSPAKPGGLYPNLSDIEATTETENEDKSQSTSPNTSSSIGTYSEDECNTSFGKDLMETIRKNRTFENRDILDNSTCSDISDVLDDMDNYLDEAMAFSEEKNGFESSPSKQARTQDVLCNSVRGKLNSPEDQSNFRSPSKQYTSPTKSQLRFEQGVLDETSLTHTISFYRKQTGNTPTSVPVKQIVRNVVPESVQEEKMDEKIILEKVQSLQDEVKKQQMIITQTSQALNLCNNTLEFMGSTEQVEAEKVLLLSTHRRQALLNEIQRLKVEGTLRPQNKDVKDVPVDKSSVSISNITLPLKREYVRALAAAGGKGHHVVCLLKSGEDVVASKLISTVASDLKNPCYELTIPGNITLKNVYSEAAITFEVYCLQAQEEILSHEAKYHIRKNKTTPKKSKYDSHLSRFMKESPAGPQAVRSPSFALMGYVVFSLQQINKKTWSLNNTPAMSPLEGSVEMKISCEIKSSVEHRGFLTMFEDISGFGAWHRRWCLLKGDSLSYWKYPDDEKKTPPIDSINLQTCITKEVVPVNREVCARLHTFLLETVRDASPNDKDTLVLIRKGDKTVIKHLLSADTREERIAWCQNLNTALLNLKLRGKTGR